MPAWLKELPEMLIHPEVSQNQDPDELFRALFLVVSCTVFALISIPLSALEYRDASSHLHQILAFTDVVLALAAIAMVRFCPCPRRTGMILVLALSAVVFYFALRATDLRNLTMNWFPVLIMVMAFFAPIRWSAVLTFTSAAVAVVVWLRHSPWTFHQQHLIEMLTISTCSLMCAWFYQATRIRTFNRLKEMNQELIEQRSRSMNTARLSALGDMAGGIAHEINNPLAIMDGLTQKLIRNLQNNGVEESLYKKDLESISGNIYRIAGILNSLKTFAGDTINEEPVDTDIPELIHTVAGFFQQQFRDEGIRFEVHNQFEDLRIKVKPVSFMHLIMHLLNNAHTAVHADGGGWIRIHLQGEGPDLVIRVEDSGQGIPKKHRDKIMMPFFTTRKVGQGTGLGLTVAANIATEHGGDLCLEPEADFTSFRIRLPVHRQAA